MTLNVIILWLKFNFKGENYMKKTMLKVLSLTTIFSLVPLYSCGEKTNSSESSSLIDNKINSIEIVKDSISNTYSKNDSVSYSKLQINTLNKNNEVISTLKASENLDSISYTQIDTSTVGTYTFTVTYNLGTSSYSTSMDYTVNNINYILTNWMPNDTYTSTVSYKANSKISTSESNPEQGFIKSVEYYIGNNNAVNLLPKMTAVNPSNPLETKTIDEIPSNVEFKLTNSSDLELNLEDYLENISSLKEEGLVKFKENVEGKYTLTLSSPDQDSDIIYTMNVVDAYNVVNAKDIFALDNCEWSFYDGVNTKLREYKTENNIPDAKGLVFQSDITFNKSDVPSFYLWGDDASAESVKGSYRDWQGLVNYSYNQGETVSIYGNAHKFSLNDSTTDSNAFPLIVTDSRTGEVQDAGKPISTHASIFYTNCRDSITDTSKCVLTISDLEFSGNMGLSSDDEITTGGPMFIKSQGSSSFDNVIVSKTYIAYMLDNWSKGDLFHNSWGSIKNCRFRDMANGAIYIYKNGELTIENSDMMTTGGPLLFLNPICQNLPSYTTEEEYKKALNNLTKTSVIIDDKTNLINYTSGQGGWFAAYTGAEAYASNIKSLAQIMKAQLGMSFLNNDSKFNFVSFVLPITSSNEGLGLDANSGGINCSVTIAGEEIYSTLSGIEETYASYLTYALSQTDQNKLTYINKLASTDFGNNLTFANQSSAITFKSCKESSSYALVNSDGTNFWLENTKYTILKSLGMTDSQILALGVNKLAGDEFKKSGYISANINSITLSGSPLDIASFKGVCNYGLILGDYKNTNN